MKVAIVIPCYNVANHIEAVIKQALPMAEVVICVDDCSKDQSAAIIEALQMSYPSLQLVRHKV
ncbi:MAG TPA: glycosyltransferase, partial [Phnomibacter sp.]|nr:glycosyltransferase [Phnomibacter sp.]